MNNEILKLVDEISSDMLNLSNKVANLKRLVGVVDAEDIMKQLDTIPDGVPYYMLINVKGEYVIVKELGDTLYQWSDSKNCWFKITRLPGGTGLLGTDNLAQFNVQLEDFFHETLVTVKP